MEIEILYGRDISGDIVWEHDCKKCGSELQEKNSESLTCDDCG